MRVLAAAIVFFFACILPVRSAPAAGGGVPLRGRRRLRFGGNLAGLLADWVMYRKALAAAAAARGWPVHYYDVKTVLGAASQALQIESFDAYFHDMRSVVGPPWTKDHKLAMAAAIVAANAGPTTP